MGIEGFYPEFSTGQRMPDALLAVIDRQPMKSLGLQLWWTEISFRRDQLASMINVRPGLAIATMCEVRRSAARHSRTRATLLPRALGTVGHAHAARTEHHDLGAETCLAQTPALRLR
jgi:hypothetical protein